MTNPDFQNLTINVNNTSFNNWVSFSVSRAVQQIPSTLQCTYYELNRTGKPRFQKFDKITAYLGTNKVFTGFVQNVTPSITKGKHSVNMIATSATRDIMQTSADLKAIVGGQIINDDVFTATKRLCAPHKVDVVVSSKQTSQRVPSLIMNFGEAAWKMIETIGRYNGVIFLDTVDGSLEITDVGLNQMQSSILEGINVQNANGNFDSSEQMSDVYIVWSTIDMMTGRGGDDSSFRHGYATDPELKARGIYRPLYLISEQTQGGLDIAQQRADWEVATRYGRSQQISVQVSSWTDSFGNLWQPNWICNINIPSCYVVDQNWAIVSVTYSKAKGSGTTTDMVLMPREALLPEPISLNNMSVRLNGSEPSATPSASQPNQQITPATH